ncbi:MAG: GAF domain-containing protein [Candidatus Eremiobacteraeota bacterium]|nr:GAF domain-containing protein [Candidatus Eremiobacteraeota bacterium]
MRKILVAVNDPTSIVTIRETLKSEWEIHVMTSGIDILKELTKKKYSFLLLQSELQGVNGWEVTKQLKSNQATLNIPVLFVLSPEYKAYETEFQADDYIVLPINGKELRWRIPLAINKCRNRERMTSRLRELQIVTQISRLPYSTLKIEEVLRTIVKILVTFLNAENIAIFIADDHEKLKFKAGEGNIPEGVFIKIGDFVAPRVLIMEEPLLIEDTSVNIECLEHTFFQQYAVGSLMSAPIIGKDKNMGMLILCNKKDGIFDRDDLMKLMYLTDHIAASISISEVFMRADSDLQHTISELTTLYDVSMALSSTLDQDQLLKLIIKDAKHAMKADVVSIMLLDPVLDALVIKYALGLSEDIIRETRVSRGSGISGRVFQNAEPVLLVDLDENDKGWVEKSKDVKSAISVPLKVRDHVRGVLNISKISRYNFNENDLKTLTNLANLASQAIEKSELYDNVRRSYQEMKDSYLSTVDALSKAIEAKDSYTHGHIERVTEYGLAIALELGSELLQDDIFRYALILHDIGKIEVPDSILKKTGPLTDEEYSIVKRHPIVGAKIIQPVKFLRKALLMVKHHQEFYDGSGYPDGLKGDEIPLGARIISVADALDAMLSDRPYRKALTLDQAKKELARCAGEQFDPGAVRACLSAIEKGLILEPLK